MCYDSNNKFETINHDKNILQDHWNNSIQESYDIQNLRHTNIKTDVLAVLDREDVLELEANQLTTNIISLSIDLQDHKLASPVLNRIESDLYPNQSVVRHSSEYVINNECPPLHYEQIKSKNTTKCSETDIADCQQHKTSVLAETLNNQTIQCEINTSIIKPTPWNLCQLKYDKNRENDVITLKESPKLPAVDVTSNNEHLKGIVSAITKPIGKQFCCDYCKKKFARKENLKYHLTIHTNVRPFNCDTCSKTFANKWGLTCHERIHTSLYQCTFCNKKFSFKSKLERHVRTHTNDRPFVCEHTGCKKRFSDKRNLVTHELIHTNRKNINCDVCNKKFRTIRELKQHNRMHDNEAPFKCNICCKSFKFNTNLLMHMKKHDGYYCKFCKIDFVKLSKLLKHRKECKLKREHHLDLNDK